MAWIFRLFNPNHLIMSISFQTPAVKQSKRTAMEELFEEENRELQSLQQHGPESPSRGPAVQKSALHPLYKQRHPLVVGQEQHFTPAVRFG